MNYASKIEFSMRKGVMREGMPPIYWLNKAKEALNISSDAKLAAHMNVSKAAISQLKSEKNQMGAKTAIIIGEVLGIPPLLILSSVLSLVKNADQEFWIGQFNRRSDEWYGELQKLHLD